MKPAKPRELWLHLEWVDLQRGLTGPRPGCALFVQVEPETTAQKRVRMARAKVLAAVRRLPPGCPVPGHLLIEMTAAETAEQKDRRGP